MMYRTVDVGCDVGVKAFARGEVEEIKKGEGERKEGGGDSAKRYLARRSRTCAH